MVVTAEQQVAGAINDHVLGPESCQNHCSLPLVWEELLIFPPTPADCRESVPPICGPLTSRLRKTVFIQPKPRGKSILFTSVTSIASDKIASRSRQCRFFPNPIKCEINRMQEQSRKCHCQTCGGCQVDQLLKAYEH